MFRLAIIEHQEIVATGLRCVIEKLDGWQLVGEAPTVAEFLDQNVPCDIVLLDMQLGDRVPPAANVTRLRSLPAKVVLYAGKGHPRLLQAALDAGAMGVALRSGPVAELVAILHSAAHSPSVNDPAPLISNIDLSPREAQVLVLYASGETATRIAALVGISPNTVAKYVGRIRTKYALAGRPAFTKIDLYHRAIEDGLLSQSAS